MDKKQGFVSNPLTDKENSLTAEELERRRKKILSGAYSDYAKNEEDVDLSKENKGKIKAIMLRVPMIHYKNLLKIKEKTGQTTMNSVCLDLLWIGIKHKLEEIDEK